MGYRLRQQAGRFEWLDYLLTSGRREVGEELVDRDALCQFAKQVPYYENSSLSVQHRAACVVRLVL